MHEQATIYELLESPGFTTLGEDASDVYCWRMEQLLRFGYSRPVADILATNTYIDLHVACDLLAHGCPERVAYMILR